MKPSRLISRQACRLKSPFITDMPAVFARADLLLCRSGASTVAEITAAGSQPFLYPPPRGRRPPAGQCPGTGKRRCGRGGGRNQAGTSLAGRYHRGAAGRSRPPATHECSRAQAGAPRRSARHNRNGGTAGRIETDDHRHPRRPGRLSAGGKLASGLKWSKQKSFAGCCRGCVTTLLSPLRGSLAPPLFTHGLRRGLYFCAASRLFADSLLHLFASKVATLAGLCPAGRVRAPAPTWFVCTPGLRRNVQPPCRIAGGLAQHRQRPLPDRVRTRIRARRNVNPHAFML